MNSSAGRPRPSDHDIDLSIASMLRFGVTLSAAIVLIGAILLFLHPWRLIPDFHHFNAGDGSLRTVRGVFSGTGHLRSPAIIQLGLLALIATPVARVLLCVVGFARQRNTLYIVISLVVLAVLTYSLTAGAH